MRKRLLLILAFLVFSSARLAFAQQDAELRLTLRRNFGYASGMGDIQGAFTLRASGPADLQRVVFYLDGEQMGEAFGPPFELAFHTDSYPLGQHTLSAVGYTAAGRQVTAPPVQVNFVSANEGFRAGMRIVLPLLILVLGAMGLSFALSFAVSGRLKELPAGAPRRYGLAGGAICPRCRRPFSRHFFSPNLLVGKLERCPFCGKWSVLPAQPLSALRAAEAAELEAVGAAPVPPENEEDRLRKALDESRYTEL
jgi:hypothetical protein